MGAAQLCPSVAGKGKAGGVTPRRSIASWRNASFRRLSRWEDVDGAVCA